jgi:ferredoxin--NADP+ reductase
MSALGSVESPLRVAVVGSGPAGFFVVHHLLSRSEPVVAVDLYERLPAPFGLVRYGVAPDHEEIKRVSRTFEKVAAQPRFRFYGNVDVGRHLTLEDLKRHYHMICFATGAQTDRRMGIPGEDLKGSHAATEFVAWYNGHPEYRQRTFDLSVERVAVVGVGNVAVDVARILCRTPEELRQTDIADYALEVLARSRVREVYMLGRRGPLQAAFTNPEVRELGELLGADVRVLPEEIELDPLSRSELERSNDRSLKRKLEILEEFSRRAPMPRSRVLTIRFLVSPVEIVGDGEGRVKALRLVRNRLCPDGRGGLRAEPTGVYEELPVGLVFRSVGYRGVPIDGLPFDAQAGVIPNDAGRVIDPKSGKPLLGLYVAGWIKRGPTGVIGTNKPDAAETVERMLEDASSGAVLVPDHPSVEEAERLVAARQPRFLSYEDWRKLDRLERERGAAQGRPRVKFTSEEEFFAALDGN